MKKIFSNVLILSLFIVAAMITSCTQKEDKTVIGYL